MDNPSKIIDYVVFVLELVISLGIGIYYSKQQKTADEYEHGRGSMSLFPVIMSMAVTFTSSVSLQGLPAEIYLYGIEISFTLFAIIGAIASTYIWVPVFYELKLTSIYHYFVLRYDSKLLKVIGAASCTLSTLTYTAIATLGPAQALESVLGIPAVYGIIMLSAICVVYTSIGGLRGVVWTDVFQSAIIILTVIVIIAMGSAHSGESSTWYELQQRNRTVLHYSPNPFQRSSVWISLYQSVNLFSMLTSQRSMLRFTSMGKLSTAKLSVLLGGAGIVLFDLMAIVVGIIIYAFYSRLGCGPLASGDINSANQIFPIFVKNMLNYPGVPGIFVAALVAGGLSTVSSNLNAEAIVLKEIIYPKIAKTKISETMFLKLLVAIIGILSMSIAFVAMYAGGTLIQIAFSSIGVVSGPVLALFFIGTLFPFIGSRAAMAGYVCSLLFMFWIALGKLFHGNTWETPSYIEDACSNITYDTETDLKLNSYSASIKTLYSLCPLAYNLMAVSIAMVVSLILSTFPRLKQQYPINKKLVFPFVRKIKIFEKYMVSDPPEFEPDNQIPLKSSNELPTAKNFIESSDALTTEKQKCVGTSIMS